MNSKNIIFTSILITFSLGILISNGIIAQATSISQSNEFIGEVESLELTVICDNYPNGHLTSEWGVSMLIETRDTTVLLDTGQSDSGLRDNSLSLNKDLSEVDFVIISHEHWDHVGGLGYIEEVNPGVTVYLPEHIDSGTFNTINQSDFNVVRINVTTIIVPGFAIVGEMYGPPYEQALVVNVRDVGLIGIMGCSHPGVDNLMEKAVEDLGVNPYMVIGGFHMGGANEQAIQNTIDGLIELGVQRILPIHCSGDLFREYMTDNYPQYYYQANVGFQMTISIFTINWMLYFIFIPALSVVLIATLVWFLKKRKRNP
jgi:7,8-dihydropterin-6-yl-methyl-4-(beta-D-ribofuranosyl)aminobenzene 5'-phosphate synthase